MVGEELAQLVIHRLPGTRDHLRPYRVFVDGKLVTKISESSAKRLRVEPELHSICFTLDCAPRPLSPSTPTVVVLPRYFAAPDRAACTISTCFGIMPTFR